MIRKQIYLRAEQDEMLKRQAAKLGISAAELIRRRVAQGEDIEEAAYQIDMHAWKEARDVIKQRMKLKVPPSGRSWTREDLYEERLARFSR